MNMQEKTSRSVSPVCTCLRLRKASRRVTSIYDHHLQHFGMTVTQYALLGHLRTHDGVSLGVLADMLVMDPTTLTRNLRPIERKGWVMSQPDPRDARTRRLHLTGAGQTAWTDARAGWKNAQHQIAAALGETDSERLAEVIDLLLEKLAD